jgi:hypothetical protein
MQYLRVRPEAYLQVGSCLSSQALGQPEKSFSGQAD